MTNGSTLSSRGYRPRHQRWTPFSWRNPVIKVQKGRSVKGIGIQITIVGGGYDLSLDPAFIADLLAGVHTLLKQKAVVSTDSTAALGAACRLRSSDPRMNRIARELALDLSEGRYELDFVEHLPGVDNGVADVLSRCWQPGASAAVPGCLRKARRSWPPERGPGWWTTGGEPEYACHGHGGKDAAEQRASQVAGAPLADGGVPDSNAEETGEGFQGPVVLDGVTPAGEAWDLLRGGRSRDVTIPGARRRRQEQIARTDVVRWAPECCTFSRARGKPVPGAKHWPPALRSSLHPYGLPGLGTARREGDRRKVEAGNRLAAITFEDALRAHDRGHGVAIENPTNSLIWELREARELAGRRGIASVAFCNCMLRGGRRNKRTKVLANVPEIREALAQRVCHGREVCDRTGLKHLTWQPEVVAGIITRYPTKGEAGYPVGLCDEIAKAFRRRRGNQQHQKREGMDIAFTEVFCGPRALLSARVCRHLAGGGAGASRSSSGRSSG